MVVVAPEVPAAHDAVCVSPDVVVTQLVFVQPLLDDAVAGVQLLPATLVGPVLTVSQVVVVKLLPLLALLGLHACTAVGPVVCGVLQVRAR